MSEILQILVSTSTKGFTGHHHSEETKKKMSLSHKGHTATKEQREHYSEANIKRWMEWKRIGKIIEIEAKIHTKEARLKQSVSTKGRTNTWLKGKSYEEIFGSKDRAIHRAKITSDWMKTKNIINSSGAKEKMGKSKKEFYKVHPESHPNMILAKRKLDSILHSHGFPSKPQMELFEKIKRENPEEKVELEFPVSTGIGTFFLDVAVPNKKLDYEYDGVYWHNKEHDKERDIILNELGWEVNRIKGE